MTKNDQDQFSLSRFHAFRIERVFVRRQDVPAFDPDAEDFVFPAEYLFDLFQLQRSLLVGSAAGKGQITWPDHLARSIVALPDATRQVIARTPVACLNKFFHCGKNSFLCNEVFIFVFPNLSANEHVDGF